jgi:hypothetical protein
MMQFQGVFDQGAAFKGYQPKNPGRRRDLVVPKAARELEISKKGTWTDRIDE